MDNNISDDGSLACLNIPEDKSNKHFKGHGTTYLCKECHKKEMKKIRDTNRQ